MSLLGRGAGMIQHPLPSFDDLVVVAAIPIDAQQVPPGEGVVGILLDLGQQKGFAPLGLSFHLLGREGIAIVPKPNLGDHVLALVDQLVVNDPLVVSPTPPMHPRKVVL